MVQLKCIMENVKNASGIRTGQLPEILSAMLVKNVSWNLERSTPQHSIDMGYKNVTKAIIKWIQNKTTFIPNILITMCNIKSTLIFKTSIQHKFCQKQNYFQISTVYCINTNQRKQGSLGSYKAFLLIINFKVTVKWAISYCGRIPNFPPN